LTTQVVDEILGFDVGVAVVYHPCVLLINLSLPG
jgi:hypothetical protein